MGRAAAIPCDSSLGLSIPSCHKYLFAFTFSSYCFLFLDKLVDESSGPDVRLEDQGILFWGKKMCVRFWDRPEGELRTLMMSSDAIEANIEDANTTG